jgi:LDH2 family malate/lactate/ureidoglycolate dehydrogenase
MILSSINGNMGLVAEGFTQWVHPMGAPYQIMATNPMGNAPVYIYIKN